MFSFHTPVPAAASLRGAAKLVFNSTSSMKASLSTSTIVNAKNPKADESVDPEMAKFRSYMMTNKSVSRVSILAEWKENALA